MSGHQEDPRPMSTAPPPPSDSSNKEEESKIEKAVTFWQHPSLKGISAEQKQAYLLAQGLTQEQIHKAWDRILNKTDPVEDPVLTDETALRNNSPQAQRQNPSSLPNANSSLPHNYSSPVHNTQSSYSSAHPHYADGLLEEESLTASYGAAMVTLGGFLGLAAAAAVRWLNGGDFQLFPLQSTTTTTATTTTNDLAVQSPLEPTVETNTSAPERQTNDDETSNQNTLLTSNATADAIQELTRAISEHTRQQQHERQQQHTASQITTDRSMDILRNHNNRNNDDSSSSSLWETALLYTKLVDLQVQLQALQTLEEQQQSEQLTNIIARIDTCIDQLQRKYDNKTTTTASTDNNKIETEETSTSHKHHNHDNTSSKDDDDDTTPNQPLEDPPTETRLKTALRRLIAKNDRSDVKKGAQLLYLYVVNLTLHPHIPRYRKLYTNTDSFSTVSNLDGGIQFLQTLGFSTTDNKLYEYQPSDDEDKDKDEHLQLAAQALTRLKSASPNMDALALMDHVLQVFPQDDDTVEATLPQEDPNETAVANHMPVPQRDATASEESVLPPENVAKEALDPTTTVRGKTAPDDASSSDSLPPEESTKTESTTAVVHHPLEQPSSLPGTTHAKEEENDSSRLE